VRGFLKNVIGHRKIVKGKKPGDLPELGVALAAADGDGAVVVSWAT
jgi:hypothetical protein